MANIVSATLNSQAAKIRPRSVFAETTLLAALSVLSPIAGLGVEMALAWRFGTSPVVDAYRIVVLIILFGQQMFVSSILPFVVVPIFAEYRTQGREQEAWAAMETLALLLLVVGLSVASFFLFYPASAISLLAPGLTGEGRATATFFMRWCGLAFIPLCWSGVTCGVLYAHQIFRVAPVAQLISNLILMLSIVIGGPRFGSVSVVAGVVLGAAASATLYATRLARLKRQLVLQRLGLRIDLPALRKLVRLAAPLVGGAVVGQTSGAVVARALSVLTSGTLAAYGYGWKLGQIVLLTPGALSTVLFPKLSETWHSSGRATFMASCVRALRATFFIALPLTCLAYVFREAIVKLLLQRGAFSASAVHATGSLFGMLILGAPGNALANYLDRMFYATQETTLPVVVDIACALLAMAFVPILAAKFGAGGVAVAYALLPWLTCGVLLAVFQHKHRSFPFKDFGKFVILIAATAASASWIGATILSVSRDTLGESPLPLAAALSFSTAVAGTAFLAATWRLGLPEATDCLRYLRRFAGCPAKA